MILACVISSMIFGFLHIVNIFAGDPVLATLSQIVDATAIGLFFAVVFLRTKKLWIPILLHGLLNLSVQIFDAIVSPDLLFQSSTPQTEVDIIGLIIYTLFITLPMLTAALVLLRKVLFITLPMLTAALVLLRKVEAVAISDKKTIEQ
jgi:CAAX amino terminal protease family.